MKLDIIIPIYNECKSIRIVLQRINEVPFLEYISEYKIIIVDDCSNDGTWEVLLDLKNKYDNIKLVKHSINQGKGAAVKTGVKNSGNEIIVVQDADLELIPEDILPMLVEMKKLDVDFVNGSRYMPGLIRPLYSYKRYFFNKFFTKMVSILINVRLTDMACGYKLFTREIYNKIKLNENRFGFEAELLIKSILLAKSSITEVPVNYFPRNYGDGKKITNMDGFKIFWTILKYGLFRIK